MPAPSLPKVLIVSACFGDGHNTAARNIATALKGMAEVMVADPCMEAKPKLNRQLSRGYQLIINHTPTLWAGLYYSSDMVNFSSPSRMLPRKPELRMQQLMRDFQPDAIVSTYPLYPYFIERAFDKLPRVPVFTVITDSLKINKTWTGAPSDHFLVTDTFTKEVLETTKGIPSDKIVSCGFAVDPTFTTLPKLSAETPIEPFKILYFPTGQTPKLRRNLRALLALQEVNIEITVVLGRNFRKLYKQAREIQKEFPHQVTIKGWTKLVPELICQHHLVIGKAGGATSHECLSATTPMLVHYLLPGQEQGNLELLQKIGGGDLTNTPEKLATKVKQLIDNDGKQWREMKKALQRHSKPNGAQLCADYILDQLS